VGKNSLEKKKLCGKSLRATLFHEVAKKKKIRGINLKEGLIKWEKSHIYVPIDKLCLKIG